MNFKKIIFLSTLMTNFAFCQTPNKNNPIDDRFDRCMSQSGGVTVNMRECNGEAIQQWDKELNKNYKLLMKKLNPKQQKALRTAQRAWIKFRDSEIDFISSTETGTIGLLMRDDRLLSLTKQRAVELRSFISQ